MHGDILDGEVFEIEVSRNGLSLLFYLSTPWNSENIISTFFFTFM